MKDFINPGNGSIETNIEVKYVFKKTSKARCGRWTLLVWATVLSILSALSLIWTPFHAVMLEILRMRPGLPVYEWWKNPPTTVLVRAYVFNITNAEEFLNGTHDKLRLEEVGPIVFREHLTHTDIVFNSNDTLTYTATRSLIYLPELTSVDVNATINVPNVFILGMASYIWDSSFVTKVGYNFLLRKLETGLIVNTTIYDYLWNFTDPVLNLVQAVVPSVMPDENIGLLHNLYTNFVHRVTVKIGTDNGPHNFFLIDKFDGSEYLPHFDGTCEDKLADSTEGVLYPQFLSKNSTLLYWRKTLCKVVHLNYESDIHTHGFNTYRFALNATTFSRGGKASTDCYSGDPPLPNGFADISKCYLNIPMAVSFPHFLHADNDSRTCVHGLNPSVDKHGFSIDVEPLTGIPINVRARLQCNLVVKKLYGFNEMLERFSDIIVPVAWVEYYQDGLPFYVTALVYFLVNVLPYLQYVVIVIMIVGSIVLAGFSALKFVQESGNVINMKQGVVSNTVHVKLEH